MSIRDDYDYIEHLSEAHDLDACDPWRCPFCGAEEGAHDDCGPPDWVAMGGVLRVVAAATKETNDAKE